VPRAREQGGGHRESCQGISSGIRGSFWVTRGATRGATRGNIHGVVRVATRGGIHGVMTRVATRMRRDSLEHGFFDRANLYCGLCRMLLRRIVQAFLAPGENRKH